MNRFGIVRACAFVAASLTFSSELRAEPMSIVELGTLNSTPYELIVHYDSAAEVETDKSPNPYYSSSKSYAVSVSDTFFTLGSVSASSTEQVSYILDVDKYINAPGSDLLFKIDDVDLINSLLAPIVQKTASDFASQLYGYPMVIVPFLTDYLPPTVYGNPYSDIAVNLATAVNDQNIWLGYLPGNFEYYTYVNDLPWIGGGDGYYSVYTNFQMDPTSFRVSSAVPELDAWALMAGGMGLVGALYRRRRALMLIGIGGSGAMLRSSRKYVAA